ncbi:MAG: methyltransferase domain-containing protein [Cyanobacteria bacterium J06635_15]
MSILQTPNSLYLNSELGSFNQILSELKELKHRTEEAADNLHTEYHEKLNEYKQILQESWQETVNAFHDEVQSISGKDDFCNSIMTEVADYMSWMQWVLFDLPYWALPLSPERKQLRRLARGPAMMFMAGRLLDDFIDGHMWCIERRRTPLAKFAQNFSRGHDADSVAVLVSFLALARSFIGLAMMSDDTDAPEDTPETSLRMIQQVASLLQDVTVGVIMECDKSRQWEKESYSRMVDLKSVSYIEILYTGIDPLGKSSLGPFLKELYNLDQRVTDVGDFTRDVLNKQPNAVNVYLKSDNDDAASVSVSEEPPSNSSWSYRLQEELGKDFLRLAKLTESLKGVERDIILTMLGRRISEAEEYGVFNLDEPKQDRGNIIVQNLLEITQDELVSAFGESAIQPMTCPVCDATSQEALFKKKGFCLVRCYECSHVYVNPLVAPTVLDQISEKQNLTKLVTAPNEHSDKLFSTLIKQAPGPNFLVLANHGESIFTEKLRSEALNIYTFPSQEAWKRLSSEAYVDLPWHGFDCIVMDNCFHFTTHPYKILVGLLRAMRPWGILYLSVPNAESEHFRLFGKSWEAITPPWTVNFFTKASLKRILESTGFSNINDLDELLQVTDQSMSTKSPLETLNVVSNNLSFFAQAAKNG